MKLSIVIPVYNSQESIYELIDLLKKTLESITQEFDIYLIDDGSQDASWQKIQEVCSKYIYIKGIKFSRNFGQHKAISAGIELATGDYIIVMDCDLQDDPSYIPKLIEKVKQGFDIVYTKKRVRNHSIFKNTSTKFFQFIFNRLVGEKERSYDEGVGSYSLISRKVADSYNRISDAHRHYLMVLRWLGFEYTFVEIEHKERKYGKSSYNLTKLVNHAIDGLTSQSDTLLLLSVKIGLLIFAISIAAIIYVVILYFSKNLLAGWASTIVTILFTSSMCLLTIGINGLYIGKNFEQSKNRPLYIIDKEIN